MSGTAEATQEQPNSVEPDYLAWAEQRIAEACQQMQDPTKRIPAAEIWKALGVDPRIES